MDEKPKDITDLDIEDMIHQTGEMPELKELDDILWKMIQRISENEVDLMKG